RFKNSLSNLRVLVAEDNELNQVLVKTILKKWGVSYIGVALNGQEVIEMLEEDPYDLIFMDIQMPIMDGYEATKVICNKMSVEERPIIIGLSAKVLPEEMKRCLDIGMNAYIEKPLDFEILKDALGAYF
ncbi:response regulator, partial [bacterium]|nr:response regulator [bacterium]